MWKYCSHSCLVGVVFSLWVVVDAGTISNPNNGKFSLKDFERIFGRESGSSQTLDSRFARDDRPEITLIAFLQQSVRSYGEKKVASSIHELAQRSLYDLVWLLAGDLEPWLIYDLYQLYNTASADDRVLKIYELFRAGKVDRSVVPAVFALDKEYNEFDWYRNVRTRMLENVDKYIAGNLKIDHPPPKIEFGPDGKPIIEGKPENTFQKVVSTSTTKKPIIPEEPTEDPEDVPDNLDIEDILGSLLDDD